MITEHDTKIFLSEYSKNKYSLIQNFNDELKDIKSNIELSKQKYLNNFFCKLNLCKTLIQNAKPEIEQYLKSEAPDFNIFKIVGLYRYEVSTHTSFLAELLSPLGTHSQSNLFLKMFLQHVLNFSKEIANHPAWYVLKEKEYIDLRIVNDVINKAVLIENKIDSVAHSGQLSRYYNLWKSRYSGGSFIYLTINGEKPPDQGFDNLICPKEEVYCNMKLMSYKHDILHWLQMCKKEVQSQKVYYTLSQYINTINYL